MEHNRKTEQAKRAMAGLMLSFARGLFFLSGCNRSFFASRTSLSKYVDALANIKVRKQMEASIRSCATRVKLDKSQNSLNENISGIKTTKFFVH